MKRISVVIYHAPNYVRTSGKIGKVGCTQDLAHRKTEYDMGRGVKILERLEDVTPKQAGDREWWWCEKLNVCKDAHYAVSLERRMLASHKAGQTNKRSGQVAALGRLMGPANGKHTASLPAMKIHMQKLGRRMGKLQGYRNTKNGHMSRIQNIMNGKKRQCPHCTITARGPGIFRWHFDNCKQRSI